ncbi:MAG: hypothetical protein QG552_739 [Thermodesulfobacteriota bacterium]|nr:hypothetical protein [Thermodesulfobacteriota bacterium]
MFQGRVAGRFWRWLSKPAIMGMLALLLFSSRGAEAKDVTLPLTLDYPLLTALVIQSFFPGPDHTAVLLDEENGCRRVVLSNPVFRESSGNLFFEIRVFVRLGVTVFDRCLSPVEWEGYLVMQQEPVISDQWGLSFLTRTSSVYDRERRPAKIAGLIWDFANPPILDFLRKITLDLAAPVGDIRSFLLPLFPPDDAERADRFLKSMRPGIPGVTPSAVRVPILAEVKEVREEKGERETVTPEEKERLIESWEAWDAFLVQIITAVAQKPLTAHERGLFLDTLLEMRYRFVQDLDKENSDGDKVREEFVKAWNRISPVFRAHLTEGSTKSLLGYLAFLAGSDALVALDELGPSVGIEISRDGLIRLARFLMQEKPVSLAYSYVLDETLRETLGLGPPPIPSFRLEEAPDPEELRLPEEGLEPEGLWVRRKALQWERWLNLFRGGSAPMAWAADGAKQKWSEDIKSWLVPRQKDLFPYMARVRALLRSSLEQVLAKGGLHQIHHDDFRTLVMAAAWQESCFRQFVVKKRTVTYLRSYNGTSVGIMQINERVWRGLYSENSLRWDIRYNATAGCEIMHLYLTRYALKRIKIPERGDRSRPDNVLAQAVYAMYNAGPAVLDAFLKRSQRGSFTHLEKLFNEKLDWVKQEDWEKIVLCY